MSLFDWLLIAHLTGDFLMQTDDMAHHKEESWSWLLAHVGTYMILVTAVVVVYTLSHPQPAWLIAALILFVGVTHIILDRRTFTAWWMRTAGITPNHPWLPIVADQAFHLLVLAIVAQILVLAGG